MPGEVLRDAAGATSILTKVPLLATYVGPPLGAPGVLRVAFWLQLLKHESNRGGKNQIDRACRKGRHDGSSPCSWRAPRVSELHQPFDSALPRCWCHDNRRDSRRDQLSRFEQ